MIYNWDCLAVLLSFVCFYYSKIKSVFFFYPTVLFIFYLFVVKQWFSFIDSLLLNLNFITKGMQKNVLPAHFLYCNILYHDMCLLGSRRISAVLLNLPKLLCPYADTTQKSCDLKTFCL